MLHLGGDVEDDCKPVISVGKTASLQGLGKPSLQARLSPLLLVQSGHARLQSWNGDENIDSREALLFRCGSDDACDHDRSALPSLAGRQHRQRRIKPTAFVRSYSDPEYASAGD